MTGSMTIVPMAGRHLEQVRAIDELVYPNPWSAGTWRRELSADDRLHVIAHCADVVAGHAGLLFVLEEVHVTTVAVHPERQGEGIGSRLVLALLDEARAHGSTAATLEVRCADHRTHRLYERFGFRPAGIRRDYYSRPRDDALVMWLHHLDGAETGERLEAIRRETSDAEVTHG